MHSITDDLRQQLEAVQEERATARRQRFSRSRIDPYRAELETLAAEGASLRDLQRWLRKHKRVVVSHTTIKRRLDLWRQKGGT